MFSVSILVQSSHYRFEIMTYSITTKDTLRRRIMVTSSLNKYPRISWARICKHLRSPGINSEKSIPPAYVAWRAGATNMVFVPVRQARNRFLGSLKGVQIRALENSGGEGVREALLHSTSPPLYTPVLEQTMGARKPSRNRVIVFARQAT